MYRLVTGGKTIDMKRALFFKATLLVFAATAFQSLAQIPIPPPGAGAPYRSAAELDQLLGPIALYPDPLIAQILPLATLPSQVVLADRYVSGGGDPNYIDQQNWDPSAQALARYPNILKMMDDNLAWTTELGQAFLNQQQDVMDAIQRLRAQAQAYGNLTSTPQQNVLVEDGAIEILPADPQVIYVPSYQPNVVYYQRAYGSPFISFGLGFNIGGWLNFDFDWRNRRVVEWGRDHPRPSNWWVRQPGAQRPREEIRNTTVWQPGRSRGNVPSRNYSDRGWESRSARPAERRETPAPTARRSDPPVVSRPAPAPATPPARGALIGVQSSHETRQYSTRGQESRQAAPRPAPAARPTAPSTSPQRPAPPDRSETRGRPDDNRKR
jgi:hypothetical protein